MDRSVNIVRRLNPDIRPGDVFALNAPYNGGTHLPDITVVTPVFADANGGAGDIGGGGPQMLFWVASRGHHADVGGTAPGSMTPRATTVDEEGVLIDNFKLVDQGRFREAELTALLTEHPFPARNPAQNIADLKAQIAANEKGVAEIRRMVREFGLATVNAYMGHVPGQCGRKRAPRHRPPQRLRIRGGNRPGLHDPVKISVDKANRSAKGRFLRHLGSQAQQLQRAGPGYPRGRALRLPRDGGGRHPDECRLPGARSRSSSRKARCWRRNIRARWWPAMSRPSQHVTNALFGALGALGSARAP
jgi:5-oxoprolinase (ATP-hydrolysing)